VVVGVYQNEALAGPAKDLDAATGGLIGRLVESKEITGKPAEAVPILGASGVKAARVVVVGLGEREKFDSGAAFAAWGTASKTLAAKARKSVAFFPADGWTADWVESGVCGAIVGSSGQDLYRQEKKLYAADEILVATPHAAALQTGQTLGDAVNLARRLVNEPADVIFPESFAAEATRLAAECGMTADVWDEDRLKQQRCGALLAVARGSSRPPRLVMLEYQGATADAPKLALVGKGVTFDSGGLSIKPSEGMLAMKCDMAGAATVLAAMVAVAKLKLPINVVGLMGLVENMVSGDSYKLGDVLTARGGRTIEVHNTDAEGRLVLADTLAVAVDQGVAKIIDLATLTGACMVALGGDVAGVMSNNQPWCDAVLESARACGEPAWQLPMYELYDEQIKSQVADIKNVGEGRWGGAITAAKLLEQFVGDVPWTHIDIAGPSFREKPKSYCDAGASGQFVRTLVAVARNWR
jgi:leucyl aminopeptidase